MEPSDVPCTQFVLLPAQYGNGVMEAAQESFSFDPLLRFRQTPQIVRDQSEGLLDSGGRGD